VAAALLAFTAVPVVLVIVVGNPLSGGLGHTWHAGSRDALFVVAFVAWIAWLACCAQLVRGVVTHVRSGDVRGHGASVLDLVAARIAVGVLALSSVGGPAALSASAGASVPSVQTSAATQHFGRVPAGPAGPLRAGAPTATLPDARRSDTGPTLAVQRGDTLWRIADDLLNDGADWTALAAINLGRDMGDGERFVDPDSVKTGWRLRLPEDSGSSAGRTEGGASRRSGASRPSDRDTHAQPDHLPELAALGMGSLACAALARRARRRHRPQPFRDDLDLGRPESDGAVDAGSLLSRFDGVPSLQAFETANCMLGRALAGGPSLPVVRAVHVGPRGVTFWLQGTHSEAPAGFAPVAGGAGWQVTHDELNRPDLAAPYVPIVFPVGDDEEGTWLVALGPNRVLPLLGPEAHALERSVRSVAGAWAWAETVVVTDDAADPELLSEAAADPRLARHVLFFGDPGALAPRVAARTAIVTTANVSASDLTILVDRHGATIHPLSRVVRPHLQSADAARNIAELMAPAPSLAPVQAPVLREPDFPPAGPPTGTAAVVPGQIDVRLLTMTPRLDGLCEPLPANRARRAVELVAYLALHQPDVITSDRLRTRVLGSSDADAAAKTLFNTAYAARRAMGLGADGAPLFPAGTRTGLYQVSSEVTIDVRRAAALAAEGKLHSDPALAIAHYRAALELVEGEPLANALSGYTWWEAEGHGGHLAAVLVDAACAMAPLAAKAGLFELAQWGLEQARLVEPYSEALSRAAMEVAAAEGDADRLRHEWRECQRRVDALDPGSSPSPRTESLYSDLSRSLVAGSPRAGLRVPQLAPPHTLYAPAANEGTPSAAP
jgi:DNA-binding SARP family transcriptional activator